MAELKHYGVLGMKWGVRKGSRSADSANVQKIRKKKVSQMSNQELREAKTRLELENQYRQQSAQANKARRAVKGIIAAGGTVAAAYATAKTFGKLGNDVGKVLNKIGDLVVKNIDLGGHWA